MKALIGEVFDEFFKMSPEEFREGLEKHKNGDVARSLLELNCFDRFKSDKTSFCYKDFEQLTLFQDPFDYNRKRQNDLHVNVKWRYSYFSTRPETFNSAVQNIEWLSINAHSELEMDEFDCAVEHSFSNKRSMQKKEPYRLTEELVTLTGIVNSDDDYDYECAA